MTRFALPRKYIYRKTQIQILTIADRHIDHARTVQHRLSENEFRVELDARQEKIGLKIREAQLQKVPYMLVIGDREVENLSLIHI